MPLFNVEGIRLYPLTYDEAARFILIAQDFVALDLYNLVLELRACVRVFLTNEQKLQR